MWTFPVTNSVFKPCNLSKEGVVVDLEKIRAIMEWHVPKDVHDIWSFIGINGYYKRFIKCVFKLDYPITSLQKNGVKLIGPQNSMRYLIS